MQTYLCIKEPGRGGLGDAIRALLSGILYARLTDRTLFVDWSHGVFDAKGKNAFARLFQLRDIRTATGLPATNSVYPQRWRGHLHRPLYELYEEDGNRPWDRADAIAQYSFDQSRLNYPQSILVMWDFDQLPALTERFNHRFNSQHDAQVLQARLLRQHVFLAPELRSAVDSYADARFTRPTIGAHVRMTGEAAAQRRLVKIQQYFAAIDRLLHQHGDAQVFLATDNADVAKQFNDRYPRLLAREKWFARAGDALHLSGYCPDRWRSTLDAATELFLLARCDYLVIAGNSSFSMSARLASQAAPQRVITLKPNASIWERMRDTLKK